MTLSKSLLFSIFIGFNLLANTYSIAQNINSKKDKSNSSLASYEKYMDAKNDGHLKEFKELISFPSISSIASHKPDINRAAAWVVNKLKAVGMTTAHIIETGGNPVVYGSWEKAPGKPTVLIYGHYDVQPVKESDWDNRIALQNIKQQ